MSLWTRLLHDAIENSFLASLEMTRFKVFLQDHHYISNQYIFVAQLINLILKWYCSKTKKQHLVLVYFEILENYCRKFCALNIKISNWNSVNSVQKYNQKPDLKIWLKTH